MDINNALQALDNTSVMLDMFKRMIIQNHEINVEFISELENQLLCCRQQLCASDD